MTLIIDNGPPLAIKGQHPTLATQALYPIEDYPCPMCSGDWGLPVLVDIYCEFYWHHVHPVGRARAGCPRFGSSEFPGAHPRRRTAKVTHYTGPNREWFVRRETEVELPRRG